MHPAEQSRLLLTAFCFLAHLIPVPSSGHFSDSQRLNNPPGAEVSKAHRLLYHSTLGLRVTKKKKNPKHPGASLPQSTTRWSSTLSCRWVARIDPAVQLFFLGGGGYRRHTIKPRQKLTGGYQRTSHEGKSCQV